MTPLLEHTKELKIRRPTLLRLYAIGIRTLEQLAASDPCDVFHARQPLDQAKALVRRAQRLIAEGC